MLLQKCKKLHLSAGIQLKCQDLVQFFFIHLTFRGTSEANEELAALPPRGWNSYDSFSWTVDETAYMQNAQILAEKLLQHGYQVICQNALV